MSIRVIDHIEQTGGSGNRDMGGGRGREVLCEGSCPRSLCNSERAIDL